MKNTGFLTTKGSLVRDILYPKEIKFKFYSDGLKFVGIMALVAFIGSMSTIYTQLAIDTPTDIVVMHALDLFTISIPPSLPAAMQCGIIFAISRLRKQQIYCISPPRVNIAGQIDTFVFDKTGTLTEDGLTVKGIRTVNSEGAFAPFSQHANTLTPDPKWTESADAAATRQLPALLMAETMASCTAITYVKERLVGDPLDI